MKAEGPRFLARHSAFIIAFVLGAATVIGYAPFYMYPLPLVALTGLFYLWSQARAPAAAAAIGLAYGLGLFVSGVSWIYVSLHDFGAMPLPVAALVTLLFCAFLALFPAAVGYAATRARCVPALRWGVLAPALWMLAEWTRGWIFTGFPWLALGYSQVPDSPLSGYAPLLGIHGVTLAAAAFAGLIVVMVHAGAAKGTGKPAWKASLVHPSAFVLLAIWIGGYGLKWIEWTEPAGMPVNVSLLQGNVEQDMKWRAERVEPTLETYHTLARSTTSPLIVMPETALPLFLEQIPRDYLDALAAIARKNGGDILVGVPERRPDGQYYNSVISLGTAPTQVYRKSHLVPFGEFIPLRPLLAGIVGALAIPLQDFSRGTEDQRPLALAGQKVAINICYEDAFGEEIIRQLPEATLLVNVSNVAWFGRSLAPAQHLQISQARALETGRYMLRATNTGVTGAIAPDGTLVAAAPEFSMVTLTYPVQGYSGATPYVRWGNYPALALALLLIAIADLVARRRAARSAG